MNFGGLRIYLVLAIVTILGACTSSGIVPAEMNLAVVDVKVTQSGNVNEGVRFSHKVSEEVLYEFSKAESGGKRAKILLDIRELAYRDFDAGMFKKGSNMMASFGRVVDLESGEDLGEFPLKVLANNDGVDAKSTLGKVHIQAELIQKMARAALDKVYGNTRAITIAERFARYKRQPYIVQIVRPLRLSSLRTKKDVPVTFSVVGATDDLPDDEMVDEIADVINDDGGPQNILPKVIEAPQLPVQ